MADPFAACLTVFCKLLSFLGGQFALSFHPLYNGGCISGWFSVQIKLLTKSILLVDNQRRT
jgi:hypothetical protein